MMREEERRKSESNADANKKNPTGKDRRKRKGRKKNRTKRQKKTEEKDNRILREIKKETTAETVATVGMMTTRQTPTFRPMKQTTKKRISLGD